MIEATLCTDAGCPWAYSANPALRVLQWRFRDQLTWRLVMIGLREEPSEVALRTFDPERSLARWHTFGERYGMPFATAPKSRPSGTGPGCRAIVAAGIDAPGSEWEALRTLQFGYFTGDLLLDDTASIERALSGAPTARRIDDEDVVAEYERQRAETRSAEGTPAHAQDKTTNADGRVRYTAPSVLFRRGDEAACAGGWQPLLGYDTLLANFAPDLERTPPPDSLEPLLAFCPYDLTTAEVALLMARGSDPWPDRDATRRQLEELVAAGAATHSVVGTDAVWSLPRT
jgi:protein-disulfide isomerase-like protein with CxxC motif